MNEPSHAEPRLMGALVGWIRHPCALGCIVRLQAATSAQALKDGDIQEYDLVLTPSQARMLAKDLARAADEREGKPVGAKRARWWRL